MSLKNMFKRSLTAIAVSAVVISSNAALAATTSTDITGQIKGNAPTLVKVSATGTLQVGSKLSLPANYFDGQELTLNVTDLDGDQPLDLHTLNALGLTPGNKLHLEDAVIEWFIYDDATDMTTLGTNFKTKEEYNAALAATKIIPLPNLTGETTITVPVAAINKRMGFKVSARTQTGNPIFGEPVYVFNAFTDEEGGPTDPKVDPTIPPGTVDKPETYLVVERKDPADGSWVPVYNQLTNINAIIDAPKLGEELRASIVDEAGNSYDHIYQKEALRWTFFVNAGDEFNGEPVLKPEGITLTDTTNGYRVEGTDGNAIDYFYLTVQKTNADANLINGQSQQGYRLKVVIDENFVDYGQTNPNTEAVVRSADPVAQ